MHAFISCFDGSENGNFRGAPFLPAGCIKKVMSFLKKKFSEEYDFRGTLFVIDIFGKLQFFDSLFLKMTANF